MGFRASLICVLRSNVNFLGQAKSALSRGSVGMGEWTKGEGVLM